MKLKILVNLSQETEESNGGNLPNRLSSKGFTQLRQLVALSLLLVLNFFRTSVKKWENWDGQQNAMLRIYLKKPTKIPRNWLLRILSEIINWKAIAFEFRKPFGKDSVDQSVPQIFDADIVNTIAKFPFRLKFIMNSTVLEFNIPTASIIHPSSNRDPITGRAGQVL